MKKHCLLLILFLLHQLAVKSQSYQITKYGIADGMISNDCGGIIQDSNGFLWICNGNSISRFDGSIFKNYELGGGGTFYNDLRLSDANEIYFQVSLGNVKYLKSNDSFEYRAADTNALAFYNEDGSLLAMRTGGLFDKKGNIWYNGKYIYFSDRKNTRIISIPGLPNKASINSMFLDQAKNLCVLVKDGIFINNGKNFDFTAIKDIGIFENLFIDSQKRKWFYGEEGENLTLYVHDKKVNFTLDTAALGKFTGAIYEDKGGIIWMGFSKAIAQYKNNKIEWAAYPSEVTSIQETKSGSLIFTSDSKCFVLNHGQITCIAPALNEGEIDLSYCDNENNIWLTTSVGLFKCSASIISNFTISEVTSKIIPQKNSEQLKVHFVDLQNNYWIFKIERKIKSGYFTINYGSYFLKNEKGEIKKMNELSNVNELDFIENKEGVWLSDKKNIWLYANNKLQKMFENNKLDMHLDKVFYVDSKDRVWAIFEYSKYVLFDNLKAKIFTFSESKRKAIYPLYAENGVNGFFILSDTTIYRFNEKSKEFDLSYTLKKSSSKSNSIKSFNIDKYNHLWLRTYQNKFIIIKNGKEEFYRISELGIKSSISKLETISQIQTDSKGNFWMGTWRDGLYLVIPSETGKPKVQNLVLNYGLMDKDLYFISLDKNENLWLSGDNSIGKFNLNDFYANKAINFTSFGEKDNLKYIDIGNGSANNKFKVDYLWLTDSKIEVLKQIQNELPPKLIITSISWNTGKQAHSSTQKETADTVLTLVDALPTITLPYNFNPLIIDFIGVCLTEGSKVKYKYFLEGLDTKWQEQSERKVRYASLAPGHYTFKLMACNNDGVWNKKAVAFSFTVLAPWYRSNWAYGLYAIGLISLVLGFSNVKTHQLKKRQLILEKTVEERTAEVIAEKLEVEEQKLLVEEKNREITDSIEYALRIQTAILPPQKIVKQYLENSFIFYKPKDIVAGDFYWMETVNDIVLFAACDCTGHGVPGAMISVLCHNALNRSVKEFGLLQPAKILDKTVEIVIENFSKSEEDIKDGMDISLCAFNLKTKELEWSGANNPLWIIQNNVLTEVKANKQPIGMNEDSKPFTNHSFKLNTGDTIYLFTDGFADQFGGETGERKLTRKNFRELIVSMQHKTMAEQGIALEKFITDYRKGVEQIDDILVMGVRI